MPHKNAEKMLEYALDAMETDEPWLSWYATNQAGDVIEDLSGDIYWGSESWEFYRKKEAQPVPWYLLEDYVHKSASSSANKAQKSVDLSVLIDSGIDCCFEHDTEYWQWLSGNHFDFVKHGAMPRMNYWFCGHNFEDPSPLIDRLHRAGFEVQGDIEDNFIITGLLDGYCWPWECE